MIDKNNDDKLPNAWFMLSNAMPPVGYFFTLNRNQFPNKARRALMGALAGILVAILMGYIFNNYLLRWRAEKCGFRN